MGIFDRLEYLIRSYLNDSDGESARILGRDRGGRSGAFGDPAFADPDLRAAFEELDEFLKRDPAPGSGGPGAGGRDRARGGGSGPDNSKAGTGGRAWGDPGESESGGSGAKNRGGAWSDPGGSGNGNRAWSDAGGTSGAFRRTVPEELRRDFAELGVPFGASPAACKAAYKELLKKHHPDRHSGQDRVEQATERSARINAAWDRIEKWSGESG
ncbi:MAG: J domain-containing protein [Treponema sp.]|jgi:hypothetical protein|nr:J domain-containing protein [Treponema sp.]